MPRISSYAGLLIFGVGAAFASYLGFSHHKTTAVQGISGENDTILNWRSNPQTRTEKEKVGSDFCSCVEVRQYFNKLIATYKTSGAHQSDVTAIQVSLDRIDRFIREQPERSPAVCPPPPTEHYALTAQNEFCGRALNEQIGFLDHAVQTKLSSECMSGTGASCVWWFENDRNDVSARLDWHETLYGPLTKKESLEVNQVLAKRYESYIEHLSHGAAVDNLSCKGGDPKACRELSYLTNQLKWSKERLKTATNEVNRAIAGKQTPR